MPALFCMYNFGAQPSGSDLPEIAAAQDETSLHLFEVLCSIRDSAQCSKIQNQCLQILIKYTSLYAKSWKATVLEEKVMRVVILSVHHGGCQLWHLITF